MRAGCGADENDLEHGRDRLPGGVAGHSMDGDGPDAQGGVQMGANCGAVSSKNTSDAAHWRPHGCGGIWMASGPTVFALTRPLALMIWKGCGMPRYLFALRTKDYYGIIRLHLAWPSPAPRNWSTGTKAWISSNIFGSTCHAPLNEMQQCANGVGRSSTVTSKLPRGPVSHSGLWRSPAGTGDRPAVVYLKSPLDSSRLVDPHIDHAAHCKRHMADMRLCGVNLSVAVPAGITFHAKSSLDESGCQNIHRLEVTLHQRLEQAAAVKRHFGCREELPFSGGGAATKANVTSSRSRRGIASLA